MRKTNFDKKIEILNKKLFKKMVITVLIYISLYSIIYYFLGAKISSLMLLFGCLFITPLILKVEKKFPNWARTGFCASCLFYIYATPFGIRFPMNIEHYYLPALMVPAMLFSPKQKKWMIFTMILSPLTWSIQRWLPMPEFNPFWLPEKFPHHSFEIINFYGSIFITIIFLMHFIDLFHKHNLKIEKSLEELDQFFEVSSELLCISTSSGHFIKISNAFCNLLGHSEDEIIARSMFDFIHPDDLQKTYEALNNLKRGTTLRDFTNRYKTKAGHYKILSWSSSINLKRQVIYAAGRDITKLKEAKEMIKKERIKAVHNAKLASLGELSAGIAHEINNPLMAITCCSQSIKRNIHDSKKVLEHNEKINRSINRITKIINGLQKFSHSAQAVSYRPHHLSEIINESISLIQLKARKEKVKITYKNLSQNKTLCNEIEIEQVLINLLSNAIDATNSEIDRWIEIHSFDQNNNIILWIINSGIKIEDAISDRIFEPFFTTKPIGKGTGLGLSIVKGILDEHQATIEIKRNCPNTCFEIKFQKYLH